MGNGAFRSSILVPGIKEAFYLSPPTKDKLPKNSGQGAVLVGAISYGTLSYAGPESGRNPQKNHVSYPVSYVIPADKLDDDKGKGSSPNGTKSVAERLEEEVRDAKLRVLGSLKHDTDEDHSEWKKLALSLKSEYQKYTPLLAKILEGLLSHGDGVRDKIHQKEEVINAANEVIQTIDRDELAKFFSLKSDLEDEDAEKTKKKMETARDHLVDALYQKGLALAEIETLKSEKATTESQTDDQATLGSTSHPDLFEENFKELRKWVDVKTSKYGSLFVLREKRSGRLGTALKVLNDIIQDDGEPPKKKFYEMKLSLLDEIGWTHIAKYEQQWMHIRSSIIQPLFF